MTALGGIELPDVVGRIKSAIAKEINVNQPMSNWASKIGHPCKRFLVHHRLDWNKLPTISVEKKMLFDLGNVHEQHVAKVYLEKAGFTIVENNRPIQNEPSGLLKRVKIHGRLDFIVKDEVNGFEFPVEVKGMSPHIWEDIDTIEDMMASPKPWMRQYPGQLMTYMLAREYEFGLFLAINKVTAEPKAIWAHQDYTYAEELIKKAEDVNAHVEAETYPDRIEYDENVCGRCDFASICLPDVLRTEAEILTDTDLANELEEREALKDSKERYMELDKSVKGKLKGVKKGIAGSFMIQGREMPGRRQEAFDVEPYWITSIKKM